MLCSPRSGKLKPVNRSKVAVRWGFRQCQRVRMRNYYNYNFRTCEATPLVVVMAIPTLDLRLAESDRREAARQLVVALEDPGFLYLQNVKGYQPGKN